MEHSLTKFVKETQPSPNIIDYIIRTKHKFLLIINHERNAKVLLDISNYAGISEDNGIYYIHSKKPILINNQYPIDTFEVDIYGDDDLIGFTSAEDAIQYCDHHTINTSKILTSKLIFSPQLANFLLDKGFKIIHLKPHNVNGQSVYVFAVEEGFNQAIMEFRSRANKEYTHEY